MFDRQLESLKNAWRRSRYCALIGIAAILILAPVQAQIAASLPGESRTKTTGKIMTDWPAKKLASCLRISFNSGKGGPCTPGCAWRTPTGSNDSMQLRDATLAAAAALNPAKYCLPTEIRKLPGSFDKIPCFNSNSPEIIRNDGILLSCFPAEEMSYPQAHLNLSFDGRFDLFSHHVTRAESDEDDRCLFLAYILRNPNNRKVRIKVLSGASYLSRPDAPFLDLPELSANDEGLIFAGPGDRTSNDVLRRKKPAFLKKNITLSPGEDKVFLVLPLPVRLLRPALNGRSTLIKLKSDGPVYLAETARFIQGKNEKSAEDQQTWLDLLANGKLCSPREETASLPGAGGKIRYGRVAGVSRGSEWQAQLSDRDRLLQAEAEKNDLSQTNYLSIPEQGKSITYPLSTVEGGTFGTGQIQSAEIIARYPDTAYLANGNYGNTYHIELPLYNPGEDPATVELLFQSAIKSNESAQQICFYESPPPRAFFRGTVHVSDACTEHYFHLVLKQGSEGAKIAELTLNGGGHRTLIVEFIYPPDATPPQELCIRTVKRPENNIP